MIRYGLIEDTPLGPLWVALSSRGVVAIAFEEEEAIFTDAVQELTTDTLQQDQSAVEDLADRLKTYFAGEETKLDIDIDWRYLNDFQRRVLQVVARIPPGEVKTYGQIAEEIGLTKAAARAVGRANATNPIPILIPCHRVIGVNGALTGYGGPGGIKTKAWLLQLEGYDASYQQRLAI